MTIRERWQRLVSRKSLYSNPSSSSSGNSSSASSSSSTDDPAESRANLPSTGASTPVPMPINASTPHPLAPILNSNNHNHGESMPKSSSYSLISKTLTWRSSHGNNNTATTTTGASKPLSSSWTWDKKERRAGRKANDATGGRELPKRRIHPSERPLTEANLRQQEALSGFKWEFGRRQSLGGWSVESGISPCGSRRSSYDLRVHDMPLPPTSLGQ